MSDKKEKCGGGKFFIGAALGAIAGAVAGIVMAPKSGEETRKDIKEIGDKAIKEGKEAGTKIINKFKKTDGSNGQEETEAQKDPEEIVEEVIQETKKKSAE